MGGINQQGYVTSSPSISGCHKLSPTDSVAASDSTISRRGLSQTLIPPRYHLFSSVKLIVETRGILRDSETRLHEHLIAERFPTLHLVFYNDSRV